MSLTLENTILLEENLPPDPCSAFDQWFLLASSTGLPLPESCSLGTVSSTGRPSVRIVLYKGRKNGSFLVFTNYDSRKSLELEANPYAALSFHWPTLERQIRIEGKMTRTDRAVSEEYFGTRPRGSQISAWASPQSVVVTTSKMLQSEVEKIERKFAGKEVPCPPNWGGYGLMPEMMEFWQGRENRLHDRFQYTISSKGDWSISRLCP